ncbi:pr109 [rat cytomegalovirus strain Maastricht]|uniref:Pr109 n=1 Tax=Rat cytomegalovirus (strain Maastricht) TaxID=79700 RepID=Q9DW92_RCMVM|nr:pr109 [rat cytomegalovirus strain Maastricht]AAF99198.1 pr109 [rat cytomegalovirus strain Maastricht]
MPCFWDTRSFVFITIRKEGIYLTHHSPACYKRPFLSSCACQNSTATSRFDVSLPGSVRHDVVCVLSFSILPYTFSVSFKVSCLSYKRLILFSSLLSAIINILRRSCYDDT